MVLALVANSFAEGGSRPSQDDLDQQALVLVEQLGSSRYEDRLQAEQALVAIGAKALPALIRAVTSDAPEVAWRAADLVERIAMRSDEAVLSKISDQLDQVGRSHNRPDLIRKSGSLRQLWKRHRTQMAVRELQAKNATLVPNNFAAAGGLGGPVGGPIVVLGGDGAIRIIRESNGQERAPESAMDPMADHKFVAPQGWPQDWNVDAADQIGMPHNWTPLIDLAAKNAIGLNGIQGELSGVDRRREQARLQLVQEVWRLKQEHLPYDPGEAARRIERAEQLRGDTAGLRLGNDPAKRVIGVNRNAQVQLEDRILEVLVDAADAEGVGVDFGGGPMEWIEVQEEGESDNRQLPSQVWYVTLNSDWTGTAEDLQLLQQIENLYWVELEGLEITPELILELAMLESMKAVTITGASFDTDWMMALRRLKPDLEFTVAGKAYLGVHADIENDDSIEGCAVTDVLDGSAADLAGLEVGDVIIRVNQHPIDDFTDLTMAIANKQIEEVIEVEVKRHGTNIVARAKLANRDVPLR